MPEPELVREALHAGARRGHPRGDVRSKRREVGGDRGERNAVEGAVERAVPRTDGGGVELRVAAAYGGAGASGGDRGVHLRAPVHRETGTGGASPGNGKVPAALGLPRRVRGRAAARRLGLSQGRLGVAG